MPASEYSRLFGTLVLNEVLPTPAGPRWTNNVPPDEPYVADAALYCHWSANGSTEDTDNLVLAVGTTPQDVLGARQQTIEADGWVCTDTLEGRSCQHSESTTYYDQPIESTQTLFVRGDTWVRVWQSNVATDGLLDAVVQQTWG